MTRKEIKQFYLSLIDNPDAQWSKSEYNEWIYFTCRIGNIRVECEENWKLKFVYIDENGYTTTSEVVSFKEIGISKFRMLFPFFGLGYRILRRIKREAAYGRPDETKAALSSVSEILSKDKSLSRDNKIDQILK
jgi:hypothetical protein